MDLRRFHGTLDAPYWRFRPTDYWGDDFAGGSFTADIMYCNWTCEGCWSAYGWHGVEPRKIYSAEQVVTKLVDGMKRNGQAASRISGGEATIYWDHMVAVIEGFLERTAGQVLKVPGVTDRKGDPFALIIETNGAAGLDFDKIEQLDKQFAGEGKRLILAFGIKSTSAEGLATLTGMAPRAAEAAHEKQLKNLMYAALECENLHTYAAFLDKFTEPDVYAAIQREFERAKPGTGRNLEISQFRSFGNASRYYTPKRFRPEDLKKALPNEELGKQPHEPDAATAAKLDSAVDTIAAQGLPPGRMK